MRIETSDIAMQKAVSATTYSASLGAAAGGILSLVNAWFQHKRNEREARKHEDDKEFHRARMDALQQSDQAQLLCQDKLNGN